MKTAKVFMNGRSQALRLPKEFRFDADEVYIKHTSQGVLLVPKEESVWEVWAQNLMKYDDDFMTEREQPEQQRKGLDELFD